MRVLVTLPVVAPLFFAALTVLCYRWRRAQRALGVTGIAVALAASIAILVNVERDGPTAVTMGGWPAGIGITLVADLFASMVLIVSLLTVLLVLLYAIGQHHADDQAAFHPTYLVLTAGVALSFLTGDLFNLFVAFEVTLAASYVLITLGGKRDQVRHGMTYVVINLVASVLFVTAIAFLYAATGTVNMAQLAGRIGLLPDHLRTASAQCSSWCSASKRRSSRSSTGCPTPTRRPEHRSPPSSPACSPRWAPTRSFAPTPCSSPNRGRPRRSSWWRGSPWSSVCSAPSPRTT